MTVPNIINDWGLNELLRRRYNVTEGAPAPVFAPEVFPTVPLVGETVDLDYLRGIRNCAGYAVASAVVAEYSGVRLANPTASRSIIWLKELIIRHTTGNVIWGLQTAVANLSSGAARSGNTDARYPITTNVTETVGTLSVGSAALPAFNSTGKATGYILNSANDIVRLDYVLRPGTAFDIWSESANLAFYATLRWAERTLQPAEL